MNNKILFMIYNGEIKFLNNTTMDHREWYLSLGGDINNYDNVIRGYVINNNLIFFKANLSYDQEVIDMAQKCAPAMKQQLNNPNLRVWCGISPGMNGASWEPILELKENELTGFSINIQEETKKHQMKPQQGEKELSPILEFKNNYEDPKFIKFATVFTSIILVLTILSKIYLYTTEKLNFTSRWSILLVISQMVLLIITLVGYNKKLNSSKYFGLASSIALIFMFELPDIIIGIINLFFTIDQGYILKILDIGKSGVTKISKK